MTAMEWSARPSYLRYARANLHLTSRSIYVFYVLFAIVAGIVETAGAPVVVRLLVVAFLLVMLTVGTQAFAVRRLRRTFKMTGSTVISYRLTDQALTFGVGRDRAEVPRDVLRLKSAHRDFVVVERSVGASRVPMLLFFDEPALGAELAGQLS